MTSTKVQNISENIKAGGVGAVIKDYKIILERNGFEFSPRGQIVVGHALCDRQVDIYHNHGLYPVMPGWSFKVEPLNEQIINSILTSRFTTCVSNWAADIIRYKLHIDPIVIPNGIFTEKYKPCGKEKGFILWPKTSINPVCDPKPIRILAELGYATRSLVKIPNIGLLEREKDFRKILSQTGIYLATTKENSSIGAMEAMACGVPIVGFNWGFCKEQLINYAGCILVEPYDYDALNIAIKKVYKNWKEYSQDAVSYSQEFDWRYKEQLIVDVYQQACTPEEKKSVSIIIPNYNYGTYINEAIESAQKQTIPCEVIVVDDGSTDDSRSIIDKYDVVKIYKSNGGVASARNAGIKVAHGTHIICLDADDILLPTAAETWVKEFKTRDTAVVFSPIKMHHAGQERLIFTKDYEVARQKEGHNSVPSCCMFSKDWWKRANFIEEQPARKNSEDAHFWLKISSIYGKIIRCGDTPQMIYRYHPGSMSSGGFIPFSEVIIEPKGLIRYYEPELSIIVDGDIRYLDKFLWNLGKQTYNNWTLVIVNYKPPDWSNKSIPTDNFISVTLPAEPWHPNYLKEFMESDLWTQL